jgi:hypothetical protein
MPQLSRWSLPTRRDVLVVCPVLLDHSLEESVLTLISLSPTGGSKHEVPSSIVREPPSDESHIELDFAHLSLIGADGTVPVVPQPPAAKEVIGTKGERIQINGLATPLVASVPPGARRKDRTVPGAMVNGLRPSAHPLYKSRSSVRIVSVSAPATD